MTAAKRAETPVAETPTRQQCIDEAGEIYGRILADPERAEQLLAHRAAAAGRDRTK